MESFQDLGYMSVHANYDTFVALEYTLLLMDLCAIY